MSKDNEGISFGMGILLGVAAGIAAGIMLAPESGEKTREKVKETLENIKSTLPEDVDYAKKAGLESLEKLKISVEGQIQKVNDYIKANKLASAKKKEDEESGFEL
ncbi:MAG: YtxH domain-containing protein [Candidatus Gastranaerophilales bacterium]|nr:YtxH domain-containing protein [Candidatus Gastranaerophilales bacterium]